MLKSQEKHAIARAICTGITMQMWFLLPVPMCSTVTGPPSTRHMGQGQLEPVACFNFRFVGWSVVCYTLCRVSHVPPSPGWLRKMWCSSSYLIGGIAIKRCRGSRRKVLSGTVWVLSIAYSLQRVSAIKNFHSFQAGASSVGNKWHLQWQPWNTWSHAAPVLGFAWGQQVPEWNQPFGLTSDAFLLQTAAFQCYFSKQGRFWDFCNPAKKKKKKSRVLVPLLVPELLSNRTGIFTVQNCNLLSFLVWMLDTSWTYRNAFPAERQPCM